MLDVFATRLDMYNKKDCVRVLIALKSKQCARKAAQTEGSTSPKAHLVALNQLRILV